MVISSENTWKSVIQSIYSRLDDASEDLLLFYFEDQQEHDEKVGVRTQNRRDLTSDTYDRQRCGMKQTQA